MEIRLANIQEIEKVIQLYKTVCADNNNKARWIYGIYPTDDDLLNDIINDEMYILLEEETIISAAVIRMHEDEMYLNANWKNHNPAVIHILATSTNKQQKGYAKHLLNYLINLAKTNKKDSIHLDIVYDNDYARKLYESVGFDFVQDIVLNYPDTGPILSSLFEKIL